MSVSSVTMSNKLENIKEESEAKWLPTNCPPPETPTESMEFLARSWSLSATELSKALCSTKVSSNHVENPTFLDANLAQRENCMISKQSQTSDSPPVSPRGSDDSKELLLLHQALHSDFLSNQLLKNGLYRSIMKGKTMGRWLKDQKERKKQESRTHNARLHAAVSVAGVAAAVAALAASSAMSPDKSMSKHKTSSKTSTAFASAAALVASHCIEIAEDMGANHDQLLSVVNSAMNATTNGDIMTLTAGAATALRAATTLRARLQKGYGTATIALADEHLDNNEEASVLAALDLVSRGEEILKRTRKGDLHWKRVSLNINSSWQVIAKMKSKHMAGTFTKKKKFVVSGVYSDIPAWPGREDDDSEQRDYFAIQTAERVIEFECRNKADKQMWVEGIQYMLHCRINMS